MEKIGLPKPPELVIPTFSEKEIERLLAQPYKRSDEGFRDYAKGSPNGLTLGEPLFLPIARNKLLFNTSVRFA